VQSKGLRNTLLSWADKMIKLEPRADSSGVAAAGQRVPAVDG
jgi:hypothetical protein